MEAHSMTAYEQLAAQIEKGVCLTDDDLRRCEMISARIRGYSGGAHYAFFKTLLAIPAIRDVLILGVYHGRDIAFMRDCLHEAGRTDVRIVGVDKFSDTACADWPEGSAGKKWTEAGFGPAPSLAQAQRNLFCEDSAMVTLIESDDEWFLENTQEKFDAVYFDTSHDEPTVRRQNNQVPRVCRGDAIICGDDYSDTSNAAGGKWGVKTAVKAAFTDHTVFADWIWASSRSLLKSNQ